MTKMCFDDLVPRFQKVGDERRIFFGYCAKECGDSSDNKRADPRGWMLLNSDAMSLCGATMPPHGNDNMHG